MMRLNVFSHDWRRAESYGRLALEISDHLEGGGRIQVNRIGKYSPSRSVTPVFGGLATGYPSSFHRFGPLYENGMKIALTMFESTKIPQDWIDSLNHCHEIIVPSTWLVDVFQSCGVTTPIHVVPLGVSSKFTYQPRVENDKFRILLFGDRGTRKGSQMGMFAFVKAFGDDPGVELIVKAKKYPFDFSNPNVTLIKENYDDQQLADLYHSCDLLIFPSCGEGFGLPPREAAASGALVITTNFSGMADDIEQWAIPLSYEMAPAWERYTQFVGLELGDWAVANVQELAALMRWVRALPLDIRNRMGSHFSQNVSRLYSWEQAARQIEDIWLNAMEVMYANRTAI